MGQRTFTPRLAGYSILRTITRPLKTVFAYNSFLLYLYCGDRADLSKGEEEDDEEEGGKKSKGKEKKKRIVRKEVAALVSRGVREAPSADDTRESGDRSCSLSPRACTSFV